MIDIIKFRKDAMKARLNVEISSELKKRIQTLQVSTGISSMTELIRKSIRLLELVQHTITSGGRFIIEDKEGKQEIIKIIF